MLSLLANCKILFNQNQADNYCLGVALRIVEQISNNDKYPMIQFLSYQVNTNLRSGN